MRKTALLLASLALVAVLPVRVVADDQPIVPAAASTPEGLLQPIPGAFQMPVAIAQQPGSDDLYVAEKTGTIRAVRDGLLFDPVPVLDLSQEVSGGLEQGLLGLVFAPDGEHLYVNYTDVDGASRIEEYGVADGVADPATRRELMRYAQPYENHNGGNLEFGPDGYLYVATGDGGGSGDPGYRAQSLDTRLGKLLRIDPTPSPSGTPYTIPEDNPFVPDPDDPDAEPAGLLEIWAYGLRNPWKFSFDAATGDLWIADVGQSAWEEVNLQRADAGGGQNYGWNHMEGPERYVGAPDGTEEPPGHVPPIHVISRADSPDACSITGGYVYRGQAIPALRGAYVFSDWCDGRLRYVREEDGVVVESGELELTVPLVTGFGQDHDGELYAISLGGTIFKLVPVPVPAA